MVHDVQSRPAAVDRVLLALEHGPGDQFGCQPGERERNRQCDELRGSLP
jgi:hypothetical protein